MADKTSFPLVYARLTARFPGSRPKVGQREGATRLHHSADRFDPFTQVVVVVTSRNRGRRTRDLGGNLREVGLIENDVFAVALIIGFAITGVHHLARCSQLWSTRSDAHGRAIELSGLLMSLAMIALLFWPEKAASKTSFTSSGTLKFTVATAWCAC